MSDALQSVLSRVDDQLDGSVERLLELLRIPSVSTDPAFKGDTRRAAEWLAAKLGEIGFDSSVRDTPGHPMVVAKRPGPDGAPHVLYYGHYDVQPPDPLDEWQSTPFEPVFVDGPHGKRIVARGASDDKGPLMTFVEAFRAWHDVHGELPIGVTVLLEGEEESGSPSLDPFLKAHCEELAADVCVVCDTGMWNIDTPAVTTMLRGLVYVQITLHGPGHDLHSGMYGGAVVNPINALARILGELHDENGRVQIPGFYDDVQELSDEERRIWDGLGFDEEAFLYTAAAEAAFGEVGRSTLERIWSRPTCDVNGIWGGYTGEGAKTVIGKEASAKVSCRLVADQDPAKVEVGLRKFLADRTPPGCRWTFEPHGSSAAIRVPSDSMHLQAMRAGLKHAFDRDSVLVGSGGSIPVVGSIRDILGFDSLLVGFGLDDDRIHSPNEKFEVRCYEMGIRSHVAIMDEMSRINVQV